MIQHVVSNCCLVVKSNCCFFVVVIVLNESLVKFLMNRDDLHMEQDSMLVDIEDLTRYL